MKLTEIYFVYGGKKIIVTAIYKFPRLCVDEFNTELQEYLKNNSYCDYSYFIGIRNDEVANVDCLTILADYLSLMTILG